MASTHDDAVQIALERRRVADELDRERRENRRLRAIISEAQGLSFGAEPEVDSVAKLDSILARASE